MSRAERGVAAFPERTDARLRELLADRYLERGRGDEALALDWASFDERPAVEGYARLRRHAEALGVWAAWRRQALDRVRPGAEGEGGRAAGLPPDGSLLVELLLSEGDHDAAWAAAQRHGCGVVGWYDLAEAREADHPGDAAGAYLHDVEHSLRRATDGAYRRAVSLLEDVRDLLKRAGRGAEFPPLVAALRREHARRRKFLAMLDRAGMK